MEESKSFFPTHNNNIRKSKTSLSTFSCSSGSINFWDFSDIKQVFHFRLPQSYITLCQNALIFVQILVYSNIIFVFQTTFDLSKKQIPENSWLHFFFNNFAPLKGGPNILFRLKTRFQAAMNKIYYFLFIICKLFSKTSQKPKVGRFRCKRFSVIHIGKHFVTRLHKYVRLSGHI